MRTVQKVLGDIRFNDVILFMTDCAAKRFPTDQTWPDQARRIESRLKILATELTNMPGGKAALKAITGKAQAKKAATPKKRRKRRR